MRIIYKLTLLCCLSIAGIFSGNTCFGQDPSPRLIAEPQVLVYKTKKDYSRYVPVILSEDRKEIVSYPDPADLGAVDMQPVKLRDNYWLDKRGIGIHVAFLKLTYKQYAALKKALTPNELKSMILDDDPLKELCDCGSRYSYKNRKKELNALITAKQLRKRCKVIK